MDAASEQRVRLTLPAQISAAGEFEILAISAGVGNEWEFPAEVLAESLPLWDQRECFVDHALAERSVRDLAGLCHSPEWDAERQGIRLRLRPVGPAGPLLSELGRQVLAHDALSAEIGFSADLLFAAEGRRVTRIVQVFSVDLVVSPARGGAFLRALNAVGKRAEPASLGPAARNNSLFEEEPFMSLNEASLSSIEAGAAPAVAPEQPMPGGMPLEPAIAANPPVAAGAGPQAELQAELAAARQARQQIDALLLETALSQAALPIPLAARIRTRFSGRSFGAAELQSALDDARALSSELGAGSVVQGPGRVSAMFSAEDQITAATDDLLGAERDPGLKDLRVARLSGIRELYTVFTGDLDFHGGYDAQRAQLATSTSLPSVLKNTLNKIIVQQWAELGRAGYRWWEPVVQVEHFTNLQNITGVLLGEVTTLPLVAEGAAYTELPVSDSSEVGLWKKYGGYVGLTLEMFEKDETHRLRQLPRRLATAGLRRISALVADIFVSNPLMSDSYAAFEAAHHGNLGTAALSPAAWDAASQDIFSQPLPMSGGGGPKLAVDARYLLVPRALRLTGMQILYPSFAHEANFFSENMERGQQGDVITVPEFSDANDWAAAADPRLAPAIILGERFGLLPEIITAGGPTDGALFTNDEVRIKARHWVAVLLADYRPLYKSAVV